MVEVIEDFIEEAFEFIKDHWKPIIVFLILFLLGVVAILNQTTKEIKNTEEQVKQESASGIMESFVEAGKESSKNIEDPAVRSEIRILWVLLGILFIAIIIIIISKAFEPIYQALNPWNIAKSISGT